MAELFYGIDLGLFYFFNQTIANPLFDKIMPFITEEDHWILLYITGLSILLWKGGRTGRYAVATLLITVIISDQLNSEVLKDYFDRLRPCKTLDDVRLLVSCGSGESFPSSHAVNNFGAATVASFYYERHKWLFFSTASIVAFSRVYVGVHYPLDLLTGAIVGVIIGIIVLFIINKFYKKDESSVNNTVSDIDYPVSS